MSVVHAQRLGLNNFYLLVSHVLVPPAMTAILSSPTNRVQGFLGAGHVCTVMGTSEYGPLVEKFGVPIVVSGFEPLDLLEGVRQLVDLLEDGKVDCATPTRGRSTRPATSSHKRRSASLRRHRPGMARHRDDSAVGVDTVTPLRPVRCREEVRRGSHEGAGVGRMSQRRGASGDDEAERVSCLRQVLYTPYPPRRDDGVQRGRLRGVLPVPSARSRGSVGRQC